MERCISNKEIGAISCYNPAQNDDSTKATIREALLDILKKLFR